MAHLDTPRSLPVSSFVKHSCPPQHSLDTPTPQGHPRVPPLLPLVLEAAGDLPTPSSHHLLPRPDPSRH